MKSRLLGYLAVILVNVGIFAAIEAGSGWIVRKHFKKADAAFRKSGEVKHPFAMPVGYEMRANTVLSDGGGGTHIETDGRGRSIVPDPLPRPRITIVVLGGSSMFGVGTNNAGTVPSQLQTALRKEYGLDVNVMNLAARGYISLQELLVMNRYLAEHRVDIVISVSGHNDLIHYLKGDSNPSYIQGYHSEAVSLVRRVEAGKLVISNLGPSLRRISRTANLIALLKERQEDEAEKKRRAAAPEKNREASVESDEPANESTNSGPEATGASSPTFLSTHVGHYAMMNGACGAHQAFFKMYFQPSEVMKANPSQEEKNYLLKDVGSGSKDKLAAQIQAHRRYRAAFAEQAKTFPFADLAGAFGEDGTHVFLDNCHFTKAGSVLLARVLAADLAPIIRERLKVPPTQP